MRAWFAAALALALAACAGASEEVARQPAPLPGSGPARAMRCRSPGCRRAARARRMRRRRKIPSTRGDYVAGGLYAPGVSDTAPDYVPDVECIPEPEVVRRAALAGRQPSPLHRARQDTTRCMDDAPTATSSRARASYYGNKFHGRRTSNQEVYDMYAFTAAHKTLPLPSFARVTNLDNGKSVVVRVNDRGPFHDGRVIDLSYAAAVKLGFIRHGTARVEVRALTPADAGTVLAATPARLPHPAAWTAWWRRFPPLPRPPRPVRPHWLASVRIATGRPATPASATATAPYAPVPPRRPRCRRPDRAVPAAGRTRCRRRPAASGPGLPLRHAPGRSRDERGRVRRLDAHAPRARGDRQAGYPDASDAAASAPTAAAPVASPGPIASATPASAGGAVTLQVASFAARDNADRALAMLRGAGIDGASVHDGQSNGRKVWRLRVGPLAAAAAPDLRPASPAWGSASRSACASRVAPRAAAPAILPNPFSGRRCGSGVRSNHESSASPSPHWRPFAVGLALAQSPQPATPRPPRRRPLARRQRRAAGAAAAGVTGTAWVLMDYATGQVLAGENVDQRVEPASITKVMTSYVIAAEMAAGKVKPTTR